ncbi:hypothetical protein [Streptomyces sp. enrichment culture]|uniref:hypothetical protein n=1 Tax=Streptomyces sp. enrichment culture TaxID=1795815 RepID=UPI003F56B73C
MPHPNPHGLADQITRQLAQLTDHLAQLPAQQANALIARVIDPEHGILGRVTQLVITGSYFAKDQAERGVLPAEVWLALGRAANELHDIGLDLDEQADALAAVSTRLATAAAQPTAAAPLVVRRRR